MVASFLKSRIAFWSAFGRVSEAVAGYPVWEIWIAHLSGGKIQEQWVYFNALGLLQQIGAAPTPGA